MFNGVCNLRQIATKLQMNDILREKNLTVNTLFTGKFYFYFRGFFDKGLPVVH